MRLYSPLGFFFFFRLRRPRKIFACCWCDWNGEKGFEMRWLDDSTPSFLSRPPLPPLPPLLPTSPSDLLTIFATHIKYYFLCSGRSRDGREKGEEGGEFFFLPLNLIILVGLWNGWCCRGVYAPKKKKLTVVCDMLAAELKVTQEFGKVVVVVSAV